MKGFDFKSGLVNKIKSVVDSVKVKTDNLPTDPADQSLIDSKLGTATDIWNGSKTLLGYNNVTYKHIHNTGRVYPSDGTVKTATSSATVSTFGAMIEVVPANAIDVAFDTHWLSITDISAIGVYILELHIVDESLVSTKLLTQVAITRSDNFSKVGETFCQMNVMPPNSRIGARILKGTGGAGSISFVIHYHDYENEY